MLYVTIPQGEFFDEVENQFINTKEQKLQLEHSLVSLSKWEAKWNKAFLSRNEMTTEETNDYIRCMTITQNVDPNTYRFIPADILRTVNAYIEAPMTATKFSNEAKSNSKEVITSDIIYYWMIALNIPFECEKWHLNKLLALIKVCNIKNGPAKKMSKQELMARNKQLNAERKQMLQTKG